MTTVYRHYDADGNVLYVGCTGDLRKRTHSHKAKSRWAPLIVRVEAETFADVASAAEAEMELIRRLRPRFNRSLRRYRAPLHEGIQETVTLEVDPELLHWLKRKAAERLIEGRPHGERSMGAVIRDLIAEAREKDAVAA